MNRRSLSRRDICQYRYRCWLADRSRALSGVAETVPIGFAATAQSELTRGASRAARIRVQRGALVEGVGESKVKPCYTALRVPHALQCQYHLWRDAGDSRSQWRACLRCLQSDIESRRWSSSTAIAKRCRRLAALLMDCLDHREHCLWFRHVIAAPSTGTKDIELLRCQVTFDQPEQTWAP